MSSRWLLATVMIVFGQFLLSAHVSAQDPEGTNFDPPWDFFCNEAAEPGLNFLPRYHDRGDAQSRSVEYIASIPNSSNYPFLQSRRVFTDPLDVYELVFNRDKLPKPRLGDYRQIVQREVRPISKNGKIVAILIVEDAKVLYEELANNCRRPVNYQLHNVSPNTLVAATITGRANFPALDLVSGNHSATGLGWGGHHARAVWLTNPNPSEGFIQSDIDTMWAAQIAFDQFLGRVGGNSADGDIYWCPPDPSVNDFTLPCIRLMDVYYSIEAWMAGHGEVSWVYDPFDGIDGNRQPSWIRDLPTGTILPLIPGRAGSFGLAFEINDISGRVERNFVDCPWGNTAFFARFWNSPMMKLEYPKDLDHRGVWYVISPCAHNFPRIGSPIDYNSSDGLCTSAPDIDCIFRQLTAQNNVDQYAFHGVSADYARSIRGNPEALNELADLIPKHPSGSFNIILHDVKIPPLFDIDTPKGPYTGSP